MSDDEINYVDHTDEELRKETGSIVMIIPQRTLKRDIDGEMLFIVEKDTGVIEHDYQFTKLVVPGVIIHADILQSLKEMVKTAIEFPNIRRNCLITDKRTLRGTLFCKKYQNYQKFIEEEIFLMSKGKKRMRN
tara:strand:- start:21 stop:419 length:399 start_codon:yes stop_codon:yes gene_type:complete